MKTLSPHSLPKMPAPRTGAALAFAQALADGDYDAAHAMLVRELKVTNPPEKLRRSYEFMIEYGEEPVKALHVTHTTPWTAGRAKSRSTWHGYK